MTETQHSQAPTPTPKMVDVFSDIERETAFKVNPAGFAVTELAAADDRILTLTADLSNTLAEFREKFPERYIELGIAETNSVSFAAGLASCGYVTTTTCRSGWSGGCRAWRWATSARATTPSRTSRSPAR